MVVESVLCLSEVTIVMILIDWTSQLVNKDETQSPLNSLTFYKTFPGIAPNWASHCSLLQISAALRAGARAGVRADYKTWS